jgi:hypothetical protein
MKFCLMLFLTLQFLLSGYTGLPKTRLDEKWDGTVSFVESETGPDIIISEWKMTGSFKNSSGQVLHSFHYQYKDGVGEIKKDCSSTSESRVQIDIDESANTYTLMVLGVQDCSGTEVKYGVKKNFSMPGGDTAIWISKQPLGNNRNTLSGTITLKNGPLARGMMQTHVYKWNLVKVP